MFIRVENINAEGQKVEVEVNAQYGPHGESFKYQRIADVWGTYVADCIGRIVREYGQKVSSGCLRVSATYEFAGTHWVLSHEG